MGELERYIKEGRAEGYSDNAIRTALEKAGYTKKEINNALGKKQASHLILNIAIAVVVLGLVLMYMSMPTEQPTMPEEVHHHAEITRGEQWDPALLPQFKSECEELYEDHSCIALIQKDMSQCDKMPNTETVQDCYRYYGFIHKSMEACEKLHDEYVGVLCQAVAAGNCEFEGEAQALCEAALSMDLNGCAGQFEQECKDIIALMRASTGDSSLCSQASEEIPTICRGLASSDVTACDQTIAEYCAQDQYARAASVTGDDSHCAQVYDPELNQHCKLGAYVVANEDKCGNLDEPWRSSCKAVIGNNPSACANIGHDDMRDFCYSELSLRLGRPELCSSIKNSELKELCSHGRTGAEH